MAFTTEEARRIGEQMASTGRARRSTSSSTVRLDVELEHGLHDLLTDVTGDDPVLTGKIALAHLKEFPDYYTRLEKMEEQAKRELGL